VSEGRHQIHLINKFGNAAGGSEWRALTLYEELRSRGPVQLWSSRLAPDPRLTSRYPIQLLRPYRLQFPRSGVLVFVGVYHRPRRWVLLSGAKRRVVIYNTVQPRELERAVRRLRGFGRFSVEVVYPSGQLRELTGVPGPLQPSLVDIDRFHPALTRPERPFTIGRLSRDVALKHHPADPELYTRLACEGCAVRIMGGTVLAKSQMDLPSVTLLPSCAEDAAEFLQGLDCFFYRTAPEYFEPSGRVVCEAIACGLPVVCHRRGGYSEIIEHGRNGFLFDGPEEALEILLHLKANPGLRESVGRAARQSAEEMYSPARRAEVADFYWS
jgi:glycosyltransferase involved in cell wall biosynthesis